MERGNISLDTRDEIEDGSEENPTVVLTICNNYSVHLRLSIMERKKGRKKQKVWILDVSYAKDPSENDDDAPPVMPGAILFATEYAYLFENFEEAFDKFMDLQAQYIEFEY